LIYFRINGNEFYQQKHYQFRLLLSIEEDGIILLNNKTIEDHYIHGRKSRIKVKQSISLVCKKGLLNTVVEKHVINKQIKSLKEF